MGIRIDNTISYVDGDIPDSLKGSYVDDDTELPIDITGYTITLYVGYPEVLEKAAIITDGPNGKFAFPWVDGDIKVYGDGDVGEYEGEVTLVNSEGRPLTLPAEKGELWFRIRRRISWSQ